MYTSLNYSIRSFMPNICVFIDIDQLKGKPMHNLVKIYIMWFKRSQ